MAKKAQGRSVKDGRVDSSPQVEVGDIKPRAKRTACPGVRVIGGRIYDSSLGKTCHQCRQKTLDFGASCKNLKKNITCPVRFCHKCLLNRYGEKAQEVEMSNDWHCPKCRGICNCSICMKKKGHEPTGILVIQAKARGFSSVSEMLEIKVHDKAFEGTDASPKKSMVIVASPRNGGKENSLDRIQDSELHEPSSVLKSNVKKPKRKKQEDMDNCKSAPKKPKLPKKGVKDDVIDLSEVSRKPAADHSDLPKEGKKIEPTNKVFDDNCKSAPKRPKLHKEGVKDGAIDLPELSHTPAAGHSKLTNGGKGIEPTNKVFEGNCKSAPKRPKLHKKQAKDGGIDLPGISHKPAAVHSKLTIEGKEIKRKNKVFEDNGKSAPERSKLHKKKVKDDGVDLPELPHNPAAEHSKLANEGKEIKPKNKIFEDNCKCAPKRKKLHKEDVKSDGIDLPEVPHKPAYECSKLTNEGKEIRSKNKDFEDNCKSAPKMSKLHKKEVKRDGIDLPEVSHTPCAEHSKLTNEGKEIKPENKVFDMPLPQGVDLVVVGGMDVPPELVGDTLQFLEFCAAFGKILDIKKGQPESIIRELLRGRRGRTEQHSSAVKFQRQLLSLILEEDSELRSPSDEKDSWFKELGHFISGSKCLSKELPLDCFAHGGYDKFDLPRKLKLLNFLCDETLGTASMRTSIEDQNKIYLEKRKEAKGKIAAARDKNKKIKQRLTDEVAKALIAKDGAPLSISEHDDIVLKIKIEADQIHADLVKAMDAKFTIKNQVSDAVRIEPIIVDDNGRVYWNLKGYSCKPHIVLQDIGSRHAVEPIENWVIYTAEQKVEMEKYITLLWESRHRTAKARKVKPEFGSLIFENQPSKGL